MNFAGLRLSDGTFYSRLTACYPQLLADALANIFVRFLTTHATQLTLSSSASSLSSTFQVQTLAQRVEDGGGLISTAVWHHPQAPNTLGGLRKQWTTRFLNTGLHKQILAHFSTGSKAPPLSGDQFQPFLDDVRDFFNLSDQAWESALTVAPSQPFRLGLWKLMLQAIEDPDVGFIHQLHDRVRLGVHNVIPPSPLWPLRFWVERH